jgi:hypothetical protein
MNYPNPDNSNLEEDGKVRYINDHSNLLKSSFDEIDFGVFPGEHLSNEKALSAVCDFANRQVILYRESFLQGREVVCEYEKHISLEQYELFVNRVKPTLDLLHSETDNVAIANLKKQFEIDGINKTLYELFPELKKK